MGSNPQGLLQSKKRRDAAGERLLGISGDRLQAGDRRFFQFTSQQGALGGQTPPMAARRMQRDQLGITGPSKVRQWLNWATTSGHDTDDIADFIPFIAKCCPFPTGSKNLALSIHIQISHTRQAQKLLLVNLKAGSLWLQSMTKDLLASPIGCVQRIVKTTGKIRLIQIQRTTTRTTTVVGQRLYELAGKVTI